MSKFKNSAINKINKFSNFSRNGNYRANINSSTEKI